MGRLIRKLLMNGIVVIPLLMWFTEATFLSSLIAASVLSVIAYLVGDQLILRMSNNIIATAADAGLAWIYFWAVASMMNWSLTWGELAMITLALGVVEYIFHGQLGYMDEDRATA